MPNCRASSALASAALLLVLTSPLTAQFAWSITWGGGHPGDRIDHAMAFDAARGQTVMFGGSSGAITYGDTWTFQTTAPPYGWTQLGVAGPTPRTGHAMVYDANRQVVVMFGGMLIGGVPSDETWEWNGSTWTLRAPATTPPPRSHMAAAPYPPLGGVVFYGGYPNDGTSHFWLWDGVDWQDLTTADTPPSTAHTMAYHEGQQTLVVHGPNGSLCYSDTTWRNQPGPTGRNNARMVYDPGHDRIVMFGGNTDLVSGIYPNETMVWDGLWTDTTTAPFGPVRERFGMVFDPIVGGPVIYGGIYLSWSGSTSFSDTQTLLPTTLPGHAEATLRGFGFSDDCLYIGDGLFSETSKPLLYTGGQRAWIDEPFGLYATNVAGTFQPAPVLLLFGPSDQTWNGVPLPVDLTALGRPDCLIYIDVQGTNAASAGYNVAWPFSIPNSLPLVGSSSYFQMFGVSQLGPIFTSNAVEVVIGQR